jgi:predicted TIM-barrel fold metal-dependent hydrolase
VHCDSSFVPEENLQKIAAAGFESKILFGSDFPITHYFRTQYPSQGSIPTITLQEQYMEDTQVFLRRK